MNNIDILRKIQRGFSSYNDFMVMEVGEKQIQAIENLIQENKELKTKLQEHISIEAHEQVKQLYIPKSKVKEKIKEYNIPIFDVLDKLPIMPRTIERGCGAKDGIIYVLQELLEEGE